MTNKDRWNLYTEGLSSPQNYIDWAFRFVIAASLQRRVAFGADPKYGHMALFPNIYGILVGRAGLGKGIVIGPATELLKFHKKKDIDFSSTNNTAEKNLAISATQQLNTEDAEKSTLKMKRGGEKIDPPFLPVAPDATTYEKLVEDMSNSFRRMNFTRMEGEVEKLDIYGHCSLYFSLPELGSLFRKRTDDVVNYLLGLYDCPMDYEYKTKTNGEHRVRRGCLNILAGTTPEFMETVFDQQLIDQGFSSRAFFIFAAKNRKNVFSPKPLTDEQKQCKVELLDHIKKLFSLYGQVRPEDGVMEYLDKWWDNDQENKHTRSNVSPKLDPYYSRKNIHVIKIAMIEHFMESTDMVIPLERFKDAIRILEEEERNMHVALTFAGDNPLGKLTDKIMNYISAKKNSEVGGANIVELTGDFWKELPDGKRSVEQVLEYLIGQDRVEQEEQLNEKTGKVTIIYRMKV